jgi:hypothetical protein
MAKHTFKLSDVTPDARIIARSALGYDFNYYADAETLLFGSTDETAFRMQNFTPGTGISTGTGTLFSGNVTVAGDLIKTEIFIDLTGLNSSAAGDIIGKDATANCHLGQITAALNGTIVAGTFQSLETPTGGEPDIDLFSASESTGTEDAAVSGLTETKLLDLGADLASGNLGTPFALSAFPAADEFLYLVASGGGTDDTYTAGKLLITLYGQPA